MRDASDDPPRSPHQRSRVGCTCDLETSKVAGGDDGEIWRCLYRPYTLGATRVSAATGPDEWAKIEWVRMDWQTCGRTHESMKWVVLIRIGALTLPNSDHLATSPRSSSLARTPLSLLVPGSLLHRLSSYSSSFFRLILPYPSPTTAHLLLLLLFLLVLLLLLLHRRFLRVSYSSPPSLSSPFLALHSIYR